MASPPPLPDLRALVAGSDWVAGRPGLPAAAARWQRELPPVRARLERLDRSIYLFDVELELRQLYEAGDFGEEFKPAIEKQGELLRAQAETANGAKR